MLHWIEKKNNCRGRLLEHLESSDTKITRQLFLGRYKETKKISKMNFTAFTGEGGGGGGIVLSVHYLSKVFEAAWILLSC